MNIKRWFVKKILKVNKRVVVHLTFKGVIGNIGPRKGGICFENYQELIKKAFETKHVKAVCIAINSPGGSPVQSELIYKYILKLKREKNVPVWMFIEDIAASGGYYLACAGDRIYTANNAIIGSIGVISSGFGFTELIKKIGIERRVYTQGENKSILDPFLPEKQEDINMLKEMQQDVHKNFMAIVKTSRDKKLKDNKDLFSGKIWSGMQAIENGLADEIGFFEEVAEQQFGKKVKIIKLEPKKSKLLSKLGLDIVLDNLAIKIREHIIWSKYEL
ncbi:signal peptide peptidase SppA [Rickettsiales endosymbiont of Stachyamoeba lipophora]|uniref:signal peptide peptidase SppA n=1 Tax=Rickettsiales endosymbiont of Stachyamoeba lipophora TaxID=2486578 RepID=UPI000F64A28F|nr:signal peptide peptidase SppA [Rickettsiales endosymbiont of Stachyamoeba lipophora]AZL15400.1 signal peptide peptidase SppA [Rickettsiales endosymbiont of Stachyamoeba lipophora]